MKTATLQALHSSASPEHGTPPEYIEAARRVLGGIDLDPASCETFNEIVRADRIYTKDDDGLAQEWRGRVCLNPPGDKEGRLPKLFWDKLMSEYAAGRVTSAIFIGFSIDQLQTLQNCGWDGPLQFPICIPRKRMQFVKSLKVRKQVDMFLGATEAEIGKQPTKANFVCYLPPIGQEAAEVYEQFFRVVFEKFGEVKV